MLQPINKQLGIPRFLSILRRVLFALMTPRFLSVLRRVLFALIKHVHPSRANIYNLGTSISILLLQATGVAIKGLCTSRPTAYHTAIALSSKVALVADTNGGGGTHV